MVMWVSWRGPRRDTEPAADAESLADRHCVGYAS
jgi:hypothetical protein